MQRALQVTTVIVTEKTLKPSMLQYARVCAQRPRGSSAPLFGYHVLIDRIVAAFLKAILRARVKAEITHRRLLSRLTRAANYPQ